MGIKWRWLVVVALVVIGGGINPVLAFRVGTWKTAQTIQPYYYQRFAGEKTQVIAFSNPSDQKTALLAGDLDFCGTTLPHAIHSASLGQPVVVVAALCNKCSALVVKKGSGVGDIKGLLGKKIGYIPGSIHEVLLRETLIRNGLSPDHDVRLTRVDFFDMGTALARGGIDAYLSGEPFPSIAETKGYGQILAYPYYGESLGFINAGMLVTEKRIRRDPEGVYRMVLAHVRATQYLEDHPREWLKKASGFGTPLAVLEAAAANMELAWDMDRTFIRRVKALGERMEALGIIRKQPDYDRLFDLRFVERIKGEENF